MSDLERVRHWATALIALHLDPSWSFDFDRATRRAGLCDFSRKRITVSRHLAQRFDDDDIHQVLLHEVAHALEGNLCRCTGYVNIVAAVQTAAKTLRGEAA